MVTNPTIPTMATLSVGFSPGTLARLVSRDGPRSFSAAAGIARDSGLAAHSGFKVTRRCRGNLGLTGNSAR